MLFADLCFEFVYLVDSKLPSYSCLAYVLLDSNTYCFVLLTGNNHFRSWFVHSADIDFWVVARYTPYRVRGNIFYTPFRVQGERDIYTWRDNRNCHFRR